MKIRIIKQGGKIKIQSKSLFGWNTWKAPTNFGIELDIKFDSVDAALEFASTKKEISDIEVLKEVTL